MAMEPISSIMSVQAQTAIPTKVQSTTTTPKTDAENAQVQAVEMVESTAKALDSTQAKENQNQNAADQQRQESQYDPEKLKKAVEQINKGFANSEAIYGIHEGTNRVTIKIVDKDTKKVLKELPPEKTLDMIAKAWEMAGILVDEKR